MNKDITRFIGISIAVLLLSVLLFTGVAEAQNSAPVANAGDDQSIYLGDVAALHGTASDPDGDPIVSWAWTLLSKPEGSTATLSRPDSPDPFFDPDVVGDYIVGLVVNDGAADSAPDAVVIHVVLNLPPVAVIGADVTSGPAPLTVNFDGTGSSDPEGMDVSYFWDFGGGTAISTDATATHQYMVAGTYVVLLEVTDDRGQTDMDTVEITVTPVNDLITFTFEGIVDNVDDWDDHFFGGNIQVDDTFSGSYTFDSTKPDIRGWPDFGEYQYDNVPSEFQLNVSIGPISWTTAELDPGSSTVIYVMNDRLGRDQYDVITAVIGPALENHLYLELKTFENLDAFTTTDLPLTPPDISLFESKKMLEIYGFGEFSQYYIGGHLTSLTLLDSDSDTVPDNDDSEPLNPYACRDVDNDTCDDCTSGTDNPANDGIDTDSDGLCDIGDACSNDPYNDADSDGECRDVDNCPDEANPDQSDVDSDGPGDVCDICPNDATDTCDPDGSAGGSYSSDGGTLTTEDEDVSITVPPGALDTDTSISITDTGSSYELTTNQGKALAVFGVSIQPEGLVFNTPITIVFAWDDANDDGKVDGTSINENKLVITKDNVAITAQCKDDSGCDQIANTFTFTVSSLSEFALVFIDDEGPVASDVVAEPNPVAVNTAITLTATIDDSQHGNSSIGRAEYSIDGATSLPMSAQDGAFDDVMEDVTESLPAFAESNVHTICVRGWDYYDNVAGNEECVFLPVYDPEGGFVTGGGWIMSPAGAYTDNLELTGRANFGFVSKYKKGASVPTGQTEFHFKVADLNFHSDSYDWLVIAGAKAKYKGVGTINGSGEYKFMLSAIDADINDNDSFEVDRFRIKIWTEDENGNETVVYDNAVGSDDDNALTEIGGGSIVIHKGN